MVKCSNSFCAKIASDTKGELKTEIARHFTQLPRK